MPVTQPATHVLLAPLMAVLVLGVLVLLTRWVFGARGVRLLRPRADYGLLTPVARLGDRASAEAARARLGEYGIRGTVVPAGLGFDAQGRPWSPESAQILVFPDDADRAREVLQTR